MSLSISIEMLEFFQSIAGYLGVEPFTVAFAISITLAAVIPGIMRKRDWEVPVISRAAISGIFLLAAFVVSDYIIWASDKDYASMSLDYIDHLVFQLVDQMLGWAVLLTLLILFGLGIVLGSIGSLKKFVNGDFEIDIFD